MPYEEDQTQGIDLAARRQTPRQEDVEPEQEVGDFDSAFAEGAVTLDETYTTPSASHATREPHATIALWAGEDKLTV